MLKTLERNIGLKPSFPSLLESFLPIECNYICIDNSANCPSKIYPFWDDVIRIVRSKVPDLHVYCIGEPIANTTQVSQNIHQINYVIRNSLLLAGNFSYSCYLAASHNKTVITVFGTFDEKVYSPDFGEGLKISIVPDRKGRPSGDPNDSSPIRAIKPEVVANNILSQLGTEESSERTVFIGRQYPQNIIEIVPNVVVNPSSFGNQMPMIRADYYESEGLEENLCRNLTNMKFSILTDKETNIEIYKKFRKNIQGVNFKLSPKTNINYIKKLRNCGVEVRLWAEENIDELRYNYLDIDLVNHVKYDLHEDIDIVGKKYRSFKLLLSDGKVYPSKYAWLKDLPISSPQENFSEINENSLDFRKEMSYYRVYE